MEEVLPPWASLATWVGLVVAVVVSLFRRWLVPKSHVDQVVGLMKERLADMESRINDRDALISELRAANSALDARNDLLSDQVRQLVGVGHTTAAAITTQAVGVAAGVANGGSVSADTRGPNPTDRGGVQATVNREVPRRRGRRR